MLLGRINYTIIHAMFHLTQVSLRDLLLNLLFGNSFHKVLLGLTTFKQLVNIVE